MATGVTTALVDYAQSLKYEDIPPEVLERTKQMLLDFLGVAYGGLAVGESSAPIIDGVLDLAAGAQGRSAVVGRTEKLPAHYAALLNATFAHSMDFDDTHREAVIHIGTPLFATLLALADERDVSGQDFLTAAVAGYDVTGKVGKAHGGAVHARGFHPTATTGIFGCAAAGGRLLGYSGGQIANALGLNVSQSAGSTQFLENGAWNKRFHTGLTAHNAILSLVMARHGYLGATSPIEGGHGYFALYANGADGAERSLDGLGSDFEVMNTAVKPYPCCRYSHATIDAVSDIVRAESLASSDIEGIDIAMGETGFGLVADPADAKRVPSNVVEGQFSVYFAAAATASRGGLRLGRLRPSRRPRGRPPHAGLLRPARGRRGRGHGDLRSRPDLRRARHRTFRPVPQGRAGEPDVVGGNAGQVHRMERAGHRRGARPESD